MMSNDLFKSAEHRAVPRGVGTRLSAACFFYPSRRNKDKKYGVIAELATERNPAVYRETSQAEYLKCFGANGIAGSFQAYDKWDCWLVFLFSFDCSNSSIRRQFIKSMDIKLIKSACFPHFCCCNKVY